MPPTRKATPKVSKTVQLSTEEVKRGERAARKAGTSFHAFAREAIVTATEAALADKAA